MGEIPRAAAIRGTTMRWAWTEGPTKGQVYEHIFHEDGTVEWHDAGKTSGAKTGAGATGERSPYAAFEVSREVYAVSYLAPSGFTLTVVLNFATRQMVGFASSKDQWFPVSGNFELVG
jgi:MoaF N-terminal domain